MDSKEFAIDMSGGKKGSKLEEDTVVILREKAKKYKIKKWYSMRKAELVAAIRQKYTDYGDRFKKGKGKGQAA